MPYISFRAVYINCFVLCLNLKVIVRLINVKRYRDICQKSVTNSHTSRFSTSFILNILIQKVHFVVHQYMCKSNWENKFTLKEILQAIHLQAPTCDSLSTFSCFMYSYYLDS